ncbi:MAG: diguanylate cyclase [Candidatus Omnitrophica bacterium CG11_big_fil_rev_8_21_14_0_20_64_10]|nr:MAG: diguanylate cyclase [Candidatus Omnitrophica bacterium CG11_big_fil_rev_8_21_14_0_20_64_10]
MGPFLLRRLAALIPTFFGITLISFAVLHLAPGQPVGTMTDLNVKVSMEARQRRIAEFHLDQPLHKQYGLWLKKTLIGDFGDSWNDGRPVLEKIGEAIPITVGINLLALAGILGLGIPIGLFGAARENSGWDHLLTGGVLIGFALPTFWIALLALDFFGVRLGWVPVSGLNSLEADRFGFLAFWGDRLHHLLLPVGVTIFGGLAGISRYVRSQAAQTLRQDYIRTARAKGLPESRVLFRHAFRNALLPLITILGLSIPGLIGGSVILETIFAIPGMGRLFFDAVFMRDQPVVMGILILGAILTLLGNLLADIAYAAADPRIRYGGGS